MEDSGIFGGGLYQYLLCILSSVFLPRYRETAQRACVEAGTYIAAGAFICFM